MNRYEVEHVTSSLGYPRSNGKAENAVKTAKSLMTKALESGSDPCLALLDWRNTPSEGLDSSPAQRLFGRRTKTLLPMSSRLLHSKTVTGVQENMLAHKATQAHYYNRGTEELDRLHPGDSVHLQLPGQPGKRKNWSKATVEAQIDVRSYEVRTGDGRQFRRNRQHLRVDRGQSTTPQVQRDIERKAATPDPWFPSVTTRKSPTQHSTEHTPISPPTAIHIPPPSPTPDNSVGVHRSGRATKPPSYLQDFVP